MAFDPDAPRTLATNMGMGNVWLEEQGLISLPKRSADNFRRK